MRDKVKVLEAAALALIALLLLAPRAMADATASEALAAICPGQQRLASAVEDAAEESRVSPVRLVALYWAETTCRYWAVNEQTGARGALQIMPDGSANPDRLSDAELDDPAVNFRLGARHLRRLLDLCGSLGGALSLYHGDSGAYHRRLPRPHRCEVDDQARKIMGAIRRAKRLISRMEEPRS